MKGYSLRTVQSLLGHKDVRMSLRYSHLSEAHLREATLSLVSSLVPGYWMDTVRTLEAKKELADSLTPSYVLAFPTPLCGIFEAIEPLLSLLKRDQSFGSAQDKSLRRDSGQGNLCCPAPLKKKNPCKYQGLSRST